MNRGRIALLVLGAGLLGSQAGHLLAYQLRFGAAAQQVQSSGAHAYFPALAKTGLGLAALTLIAALLITGAARLVVARPIAGAAAPSLVRLLAVIYTVQLAGFAAQETAEAALGAGSSGSAPLLLLVGAAGQLPVAVAASLAVRWLLTTVHPAVAVLRIRPTPAGRLVVAAFALRTWPLATAELRSIEIFDSSYVRGPPSS